MSNLTPGDLSRLLRLARLSVDEAEAPHLLADLDKILGYIDVLRSVDTTGVTATAHVAVESLPLRPDIPCVGLTHEEALAGAPRTAGGGFAVPGFVEEG